MPAEIKGGNRWQAKLNAMATRLGEVTTLRVGFLEGTVEEDGTPTPEVAFINEFGASIQRPAGTTTIYRSVNPQRTGFLLSGKFVKKAKANFASTHPHDAYTITIPPRPFFRNMILANKASWGQSMRDILRAADFDADAALHRLGFLIKGQLQASINITNSPPNAPSTVRKKGFQKPLIDTGVMWKSVDFEVQKSTDTT